MQVFIKTGLHFLVISKSTHVIHIRIRKKTYTVHYAPHIIYREQVDDNGKTVSRTKIGHAYAIGAAKYLSSETKEKAWPSKNDQYRVFFNNPETFSERYYKIR